MKRAIALNVLSLVSENSLLRYGMDSWRKGIFRILVSMAYPADEQ
jgi:hypothetical protein